MADINLLIFVAIGVVLGGTFTVTVIYVTCKFCSEYLHGDNLFDDKTKEKEKYKESDEPDKQILNDLSSSREPEENICNV